jgi:predicted transcriptional regulator
MKMDALKLELIQKIIDRNDLEVLMQIDEILNRSNVTAVNESSTIYSKEEKVYVFNEWQQKRIDIALEQVANGEFLTDEEAEKDIQEWFKEQEKLFGQ